MPLFLPYFPTHILRIKQQSLDLQILLTLIIHIPIQNCNNCTSIMKPDKLQIPEISKIYIRLELELRTFMQIYQRGGRVTRSTLGSNNRLIEPKIKQRYKTLIHYLGDPCLNKYLQTTNIKYKEMISNEYFVNKKLRRLNKQHLPQNCLYYEKNTINQQISYRLRFVKLNPKKSKTNQYFIEETNRPSKSLNSQDDGVLTAVQSLVFYLISFEEFQKVFGSILLDLKNNYKAIKIEEFSRVSQQKQNSNPPVQNEQREIMQVQPSIELNENVEKEPIQQQIKKPDFTDPKQFTEALDKQISELDRQIYKRMCLPNINGILWPCVVLQPIVNEKEYLQTMVQRRYDQASKDEYRSSKTQIKYDEKVFHHAFQEYLDELGLDHTEKVVDKQKKILYIEGRCLRKMDNILRNLQDSKQSKIIVNLIGTHETKILRNSFIKWQDFDFAQIQEIIMKTPMRGVVDLLNEYIDCLNRFKKLEYSNVEGKHSLYRLCKYQKENGTNELCLPLRNEQTKDEKKILVRFLRDQHPLHEQILLQWVDYSKITVNLTFPKHNQIQKKFYYILGNNISIQEGINYIYSDFHYKVINFNEVLRLCYPLYDLRKVKIKQQRCISCYYQIQNLPYYRCKFCLRFCHQQCMAVRPKPMSQTQTSGIPLDIYDTQNDEELWNCSECTPCVQCQMAVKQNSIQCFSCKNVYHLICGKLKGSDQTIDEEKYTCENCLKCRMCNAKVKYQQYCIQQKNILCVKCYKIYTNNEYCALCMKEAHGDWVQCDQKTCKKWIHISCDSYFKEKKLPQLKDLNYSCPNCRKLQKRKIYRNIIEQLKFFDEFQYFYQPDYQELIGYKQAIKDPICIYEMRQKSLEGAYDNNAYQLIKADLELLVKNAMTFNMPKDEAHYRAKILLVIGTKYLSFFKDIIECSLYFLVNENIQQIYLAKKKQFYNDLYEHYLEYLLNFGQERGVVQVKKISHANYEQQFFSSKIILSKIFAYSQFTFKIKKKPHKIQNLFTIPRLSTAAWCPVRSKNCYYHPDQSNPIIYECRVCWQTYCCVKTCFNHRICTNCGQKGCGCDRFQCKCPIMKEKERKQYEAKIHSSLAHSKLEKRQYTEYYKYCLKCVNDNLRINWCYVCHNFCYYAYEKCADCNRVYHLNCQKKNKWEELSLFFQSKTTYRQSYQNVRVPNTCYACSYSQKNAQMVKQKLSLQTKITASKINVISKYLPIFNYIYELNGIRLAPHQIINLLSHNYQNFTIKQPFFNEFLLNFSVVIENMGNNRISRQQFRDYFTKQKISGRNSHQKIISIVQTKDIKQLKQSKKFYKIYSKWFNHFYYPENFTNTYEIKYHLEHLTSKINHCSGLSIGFSQIFQYMITDHQHMVAANFREDNHINTRNFERLKIESITTHVSPKSKKNIYYTNKLEKNKLHSIFYLNYLNYKAWRVPLIQQRPFEIQGKRIFDPTQFLKIVKEYQRYFRFHSDNENLTDCIYKQQSSKTILSNVQYFLYFNPFQQNTQIVKYNKLSLYREHESIYINNKSQMLYKYLSQFALKIFQENKVVLKKGNTSILSQSKQCWRILKKIKDQNVEIKLEKSGNNWVLYIGEWMGVVKSIDDIIRKFNQICPIVKTFEDIAEFMGFGMTDSTFYEPNHFTHLLQTLPLDSLNRKQRKIEVLKVYDKYEWQRQGNFTLHNTDSNGPPKFQYNVTKKEIFYLKKRNQMDVQENIVQPKVIPFITFDDIKKDLDQPHTTVVKEKQHLVIKEPNFDAVYIAPSKIDRLGLFIRNNTKKNTVVAQYIGQIISEAMADVRQQKFRQGCYMFGLGKNHTTRLEIIDATFVGNKARYLNHSCEPNCKAKIQTINGQPRILIYTIKDVKQNDELTYDYQFKIDTNDRLICKCKSKNCQGRLT